MAHIRTIETGAAQGVVKRIYDDAIKRAGKVFNVVKILSIKPESLRRTMLLFQTVMRGPSGLSRVEREMLAVITSQVNNCHY